MPRWLDKAGGVAMVRNLITLHPPLASGCFGALVTAWGGGRLNPGSDAQIMEARMAPLIASGKLNSISRSRRQPGRCYGKSSLDIVDRLRTSGQSL
jgi:hypothetical protein